MRYLSVVTFLLLAAPSAAVAQISIQIGLPSVSIGFDQVDYPHLVEVPGYPVYYDPSSRWNYFFYDGLYWVYERDSWYASSWFNGPWDQVEPQDVPLFILRVPVSYYRQPPRYFRGWRADEPPRWGEHWGRGWERERRGWDQWDRRQPPAAAPLPVYQRQFSGARYPRPQEQQVLRSQNYRHEPRDAAAARVYKAEVQRAAHPPAPQRQPAPPVRAQPAHPAEPVRNAAPPARAQPAHPAEPQRNAAPPARAQPQPKPQPQAAPSRAREPQQRAQPREQIQEQQGKKSPPPAPRRADPPQGGERGREQER